MNKKIFIILYIFLLIVLGKLVFTYSYNEHIKNKVKENTYAGKADALTFANVYQPYIAHYNRGNIFYNQGNYDEAIKEYNKALKCSIPEGKECSVRVNLALSIIGKLPYDYDSPDKIDESIATLKEAREVLMPDGCANEEGTGHSKEAEKLKKQIDDLIDELENRKNGQSEDNQNQNNQNQDNQNQDNQNQDNQNQNSTETDAEEEHINQLEQQFLEQQSEAYEERQDEMESLHEMYEFDFNFDNDGIW